MTRRSQQYPRELRERVVRMVVEVTPNYESQWAAIGAAAEKLGVGSAETVRNWVRRAEIDAGELARRLPGRVSQTLAAADRGSPTVDALTITMTAKARRAEARQARQAAPTTA